VDDGQIGEVNHSRTPPCPRAGHSLRAEGCCDMRSICDTFTFPGINRGLGRTTNSSPHPCTPHESFAAAIEEPSVCVPGVTDAAPKMLFYSPCSPCVLPRMWSKLFPLLVIRWLPSTLSGRQHAALRHRASPLLLAVTRGPQGVRFVQHWSLLAWCSSAAKLTSLEPFSAVFAAPRCRVEGGNPPPPLPAAPLDHPCRPSSFPTATPSPPGSRGPTSCRVCCYRPRALN
jgi:hypothetical protein